MFQYPKNLYTDVRIEEVNTLRISYKKHQVQEEKKRNSIGAFIRIFDGEHWYYYSTTDMTKIQESIFELAKMAKPNEMINKNPIVMNFEVNKDCRIQYKNEDEWIGLVAIEEKHKLLVDYMRIFDAKEIAHYSGMYVENYQQKSFYSSKGTAVQYDKQTCGYRFILDLASGKNRNQVRINKGAVYFDELLKQEEKIHGDMVKEIDFLLYAEPIEAGEYTVIFSPEATGVFAHESFGHKSESDFMVGDETMKEEWVLGKCLGYRELNIVDDATLPGNGYLPYDDEGNHGRKTYIVEEGKLTGRLHNTQTATLLGEAVTGNARVKDIEFEPIVRMRTTYIEKGNRSLAEMIATTSRGIFVETTIHGSGMSTFTIAPGRAYLIENGEITKPVKASVIMGSVFGALSQIDAISEEFELFTFVTGGCGKMEQYPLPVGFGGPYIRVNNLNVQ